VGWELAPSCPAPASCGRIPESQHGRGWKGPLGSPSPTPCPSRVTQSRLHSTTSRGGLNISREGDSTASLGSLGQGWEPELLPQFHTHAMSSRVLSSRKRAPAPGGTPHPGSPMGLGQPPHPQQPSAPSTPPPSIAHGGWWVASPAPGRVLQRLGPPAVPPSRDRPWVRPRSSAAGQARPVGAVGGSGTHGGDNRPAPGTGSRGEDGNLWAWGARGAPCPPPLALGSSSSWGAGTPHSPKPSCALGGDHRDTPQPRARLCPGWGP